MAGGGKHTGFGLLSAFVIAIAVTIFRTCGEKAIEDSKTDVKIDIDDQPINTDPTIQDVNNIITDGYVSPFDTIDFDL